MRIIPDSPEHPTFQKISELWRQGLPNLDGLVLLFVCKSIDHQNIQTALSESGPIILCFNELEHNARNQVLNVFSTRVIYSFDYAENINWDERLEIIGLKAENHSLKSKSGIENKGVITILHERKFHIINPRDIMYITPAEKNKRKCIIQTTHHVLQCNKSLSHFQTILDESFIQVNRHTLVNIHYVIEIERFEKEITLRNNHTFSLGRAFEKEVKAKVLKR